MNPNTLPTHAQRVATVVDGGGIVTGAMGTEGATERAEEVASLAILTRITPRTAFCMMRNT